ncbi:dephospho-CoA kinase-domain-containing protein [Dipodascopsis uninucleata]
MLILGLTGGIATGKSTVSSLLSQPPYSYPVIDADKIARDVVRPGTVGYRRIIERFQSVIPDLVLSTQSTESSISSEEMRPLNRAALGKHVFADESARKALNAITHPLVRREIFRQIVYHWLITRAPVVVLDVPLLFEAKMDLFCGATLVVSCSADIQRTRLLVRDKVYGLTAEDAEKRIAAQMSMRDKEELSDLVVCNDGSLEDLKKNLARVLAPVVPSQLRSIILAIPPFGLVYALFTFLQRFMTAKNRKKLT